MSSGLLRMGSRSSYSALKCCFLPQILVNPLRAAFSCCSGVVFIQFLLKPQSATRTSSRDIPCHLVTLDMQTAYRAFSFIYSKANIPPLGDSAKDKLPRPWPPAVTEEEGEGRAEGRWLSRCRCCIVSLFQTEGPVKVRSKLARLRA